MNTTEFTRVEVIDDDPDTSYLGQDGFEDRLASYDNGDFYFIGIQAKTTVSISTGENVILHDVVSPGVWGIESDSGEEYLEEVFQDECATLANMLEGLKQ